MDKRTCRREYCESFSRAIKLFRQENQSQNQNQISCVEDNSYFNEGKLTVMVRKRPIFSHELQNSEFDVVTCLNRKNIVVHDARMQKDMKSMFMNHYEFTFDVIFDEKASNQDVYKQSAAPLLKISKNGGYCTCMVYGQTGSGKTFTMSSIYEQVANELFADLETEITDQAKVVNDTTSTAAVTLNAVTISLTMIEIAGDHCHDLLNSFTPAQLLTTPDGGVEAYPLVEPQVSSAEELYNLIQFGCGVRSTAATGVHDTSSRSHAILKIYIRRINDGGAVTEGVLTLVDLAGSEHKIGTYTIYYYFYNELTTY